jgi:hypothetical protein
MTSLATTVSTPVPVRRRRARATLLTAAAVAAACALIDLLAPPSSGSHLSTAADYAFTALLFPFVLATIAVITLLHRMQDGRLGKAGYIAASVALAAFIPCGIDSLATGNAQALGPVYILAILGSLAGLILFAIGSFRARLLPRWAGPLLPLAWLLGGPLATGAVRGATLILAAAYTVIALTLPDPES